MNKTFGGSDYRQGALERLREAYRLLDVEQFAGSIYLGGRAVEAMLRAVIWLSDDEIQRGRKSLETGHNLRELLTLVRNMGLLRADERDDDFEASVQKIGRLWFNNLRFASIRFVDAHWRAIGEVHSRRTIKKASREFYNACSIIIKRGDLLCQH